MLAENFEWIVIVTSIMAVGKLDISARINVKRFMNVLNMVRSELTFKEVLGIANALCVIEDKMLLFYDFMKPIKLLLAPPEIIDEPSSPPSPEAEVFTKSFDQEDKKADESPQKDEKNENEKKPEEEKKEEPQVAEPPPEPEIPLTELDEDWCSGEFTIIINRCHNCHKHKDYTWHSEDVY